MPPKKTVRARSSSPAPTVAAKVSRAEAKKNVPAAAVLASKVDPEVPLDPATGIVYHLGCAAKDIAQRFIFVGDPGRVPVVAERFDKNSITYRGSHREIAVITGKYKGTPVTVLSTGMGTDNCEIVLNEIHALQEYNVATGEWAKKPAPVKIIRVGTCGSPRGEVEVGTLAITQHAIGMDNTCRYYDAPASIHPASVRTLEGIVNKTAFSKVGGVYCSKAAEGITKALTESFNGNAAVKKRRGSIVGTTASGSGFYGCQGRAVGRFRQHLAIPNLVDLLGTLELPLGTGKSAAVEKVVNIEMENSCICFLSRMLGYEAGTVCAIIAARAGDKRAFATPDQAKSAIADAITVALDALIAA